VVNGTNFAPEIGVRVNITGFNTLFNSALNLSNVYDIFAADVDGDGDIDLAWGAENNIHVGWLDNNGAGSFTVRTISNNGPDATSIVVGDFDGRGVNASTGDRLDFLRSDTEGGDDLFVYLQQNNSITTQRWDYGSNFNTDVNDLLSAGDIDGDGDVDFVFLVANQAQVGWYENTGAGSFSTGRNFIGNITFGNHNLLDGEGIDTVDVDGDGDVDVIVGGRDEVVWFSNNGTGSSFTRVNVTFNSSEYFGSVFGADMDNDGDIDIVVGTNNNTTGSIADLVWYELNNGVNTGIAHTISVAGGLGNVTGVYVEDVNQDGANDVVAVSRLSSGSSSSTVAWFESDGSGDMFEFHLVVANAGSRASSVEVADFNGDGVVDIAVGFESSSEIKIYDALVSGVDSLLVLPMVMLLLLLMLMMMS